MLALVLPYVDLPSLPLPFGLSIHPFGVLAALGAYLGARLALHAARVYAPGDTRVLAGVFTWTIVGGVLGAHLLHVLGYHPELLRTSGPWVLLKVWDGVSSMGGVLGGLAGIFLYFRAHAQPVRPYLDALALGAAPGWAVARVGCALVHDHPGIRSDAWFAVAFPGGARLDMGLVDCLLLVTLSALLWLLARRRWHPGLLMGVLAVGYCIPRFFLDFLRAQDLAFVDGRFGGLTPAQWLSPVLALAGLYLIVSRPRPADSIRSLDPVVEAADGPRSSVG